MKYLQFYVKSSPFKFDHLTKQRIKCEIFNIEKCGSDGVRLLDGRLSIDSCIDIGIEYINKKENINITGFELRNGYSDSFEPYNTLYSYFKNIINY